MPDFDAIIIGTGQAGPSLAFRLAGAGMKVAVVERHLVGGTCVNTGCTPTKALVASAYAARIARRGAEYGVAIGGDVGVDMRRVKARKDAIVAASRNGLTSALENAANITLYRGHARFAAPRGGNHRDYGDSLPDGRITVTVYRMAPCRYQPARKPVEGSTGMAGLASPCHPARQSARAGVFRGRRLSPLSATGRRGIAARWHSSLGLLPDAQSRPRVRA